MSNLSLEEEDKILEKFAKEMVVDAYSAAIGTIETQLLEPQWEGSKNLMHELKKLDSDEDRYLFIAQYAAEMSLSYFFGKFDLVPGVAKISLLDEEEQEHGLEDILGAPFAIMMLPDENWIGKYSKYEHVSQKIQPGLKNPI